MLTLEIASILPSHWGFSHEVHEVPDFVPIIVPEQVVDLVEVVRLLGEHDKFLLLRLDHVSQLLNTSSVIIGLEFVFSNLCLTVRRVLICSLSEFCLWISWPCAWLMSQQSTDFPVLSWLIDDDRQDDRPSPSEWSARLRHASSSRSWVNSGEESAMPMV